MSRHLTVGLAGQVEVVIRLDLHVGQVEIVVGLGLDLVEVSNAKNIPLTIEIFSVGVPNST